MADYNPAKKARLLQYNIALNEVLVDVTHYALDGDAEKYIGMGFPKDPIRVIVWKQTCALKECDVYLDFSYVPNILNQRIMLNQMHPISVPNKINETTEILRDSAVEDTTKDATVVTPESSLIVDVEPSCSYKKGPGIYLHIN
ncbi:hypothetical protein FQA39_LY09208 [Lamprigera yunnana]|nr:hypothetical protein FQA39_LY09208 [Lamprigera yunnana]